MRQLSSKIAILTFVLGILIGGVCGGVAVASQTHMQNALSYLNSARNELEAAQPDKGGHRTNAINLVNQAMQQVHEGIQYARY